MLRTAATPDRQGDLREIIFPETEAKETQQELLNQTQITQPALFAIEYSMARLWMSWGIQPVAMIGHSIGEYVAACLSGVFSLQDALAIIAKRASLIQSLPAGTMLAISESAELITGILPEQLAISAINTPGSCVVGGETGLINNFIGILKEKDIEHRTLKTSHAFHSAMMEPILDEFQAFVAQRRLNKPELPFISSVTGEWIKSEQAQSPQYWSTHIRAAVQFSSGRQRIGEDYPDTVLLEVGPGNTLTTLARAAGKTLSGKTQLAISSLGHVQDSDNEALNLMSALGNLWCEGVAIDWSGFYHGEDRSRVELPVYPLQR